MGENPAADRTPLLPSLPPANQPLPKAREVLVTGTCGGIILCGGQSRRMGFPKALLPVGSEPMLARVARILSEVASPLVVVAAPDQQLPDLPAAVIKTKDNHPGRGPLEGLAAGLSALAGSHAEHVFLTSCDVPLLRAEFVKRMIQLSQGVQIAVPYFGGYFHPLAAVYQRTVEPQVQALLAADRLRPVFLFEEVTTRKVEPEAWSDVDPDSESLCNLNSPADYRAALAKLGLTMPADIEARLINRPSP